MTSQKAFIQEQWEQYVEPKVETKQRGPNRLQKAIWDSRVRLFSIFFIFAITVPVLIFYFLIDQTDFGVDNSYTCAVDQFYRVSCGSVNISTSECIELNCCYDNKPYECYHSIPPKYVYTKVSDGLFKPSKPQTPFETDSLQELKFGLKAVDMNQLQIILSTSSSNEYVPLENQNYNVKIQENLLGVEVFRAATNELILTTLRGPVIASEQYWEWTFQLISEKFYGLGELILPNKTISRVIYKNQNDHSTLPTFMGYLNGSFHGVAVEHDGPLEVTVLPSSRLVILRSLAENNVVLKLVTGPMPRDVRKQLSSPHEFKLPKYWMLGAHICRDGKTTINSAIEEYEQFIKKENTIQFDSDCIHENLYPMLHQKIDEKYDLKQLVKELQANSHFMMTISPQIVKENLPLYNKAVELNILWNKAGEIFNGRYLEQVVVYPDFTHNSINMWMEEMKTILPAALIDGFVLRDNWPVEEIYEFDKDSSNFPYVTEILNSSFSKTIPLDATNSRNEPHILHHNKYGKAQVDAFNNHMQFDFLLSSSYDYTIQDAALVQNVNISWTNLKKAVITTLFHSILGNPLISIPICGSTNYYNKQQNEELCIRWYIAAATMPLFRISSDWPRRDPSSLETAHAYKAALEAIEGRFRLLPYFYTILSLGEPLVRPMFYDFHSDNVTLELDEQYMLGDALLVAQQFLPGATQVRVYLPPSVEVWYEFWGGRQYKEGGWVNMYIVETDWIMFVAAGNIIPMRYNQETKITSRSPTDVLRLVVALKCTSGTCSSEGSMKLDSTTLNFQADENGLTIDNIILAKTDIKCDQDEREWPSLIEKIIIYGLDEEVKVDFPRINICSINEDTFYIEYFKIK